MKTWEVDPIILCLCGEVPKLLCLRADSPSESGPLGGEFHRGGGTRLGDMQSHQVHLWDDAGVLLHTRGLSLPGLLS